MQIAPETAMLYVAFVLSIINSIIACMTLDIRREKSKPALKITLETLPPYAVEELQTLIHIKNNGGRSALLDMIEVLYQPVLSEPILISDLDNDEVSPNEEVSEGLRLPEPIPGMNKILVTLYYRYGWIWKKHETWVHDFNFLV